MNRKPDLPVPGAHGRALKILMLVFVRRDEGTYYRAFPWARYLVSRGHTVTLMCLSPTRRFCGRTEYADGVRIIETPNFLDGRGVLRRMTGMTGWGPLDAAMRLSEICRGGYDLVHTFEHHLNVALPVFLAGRRHVPLLVADWCDHYGAGGFRRNGRRPRLDPIYRKVGLPLHACTDYLERALRLRANGVTVISSYLQQRALDLGVARENICLIPGSAEVRLVRPRDQSTCRERQGVPVGPHVAAFFGASHYDLDLALEAFLQVLRVDPDALLLLLGKLPKALEQRIQQFNLTRHVLCTGWIQDADLESWLACPDVFILPMRDTPVNRARWPNKIGFYMAAGRPTVCSDIGDVAELVRREGVGLVAAPGTEKFADRILELFGRPDLAMALGRQARDVAERLFDPEQHGQVLEAAYHAFAMHRAHATTGRPGDALTTPPDINRHGGAQGDKPCIA